MEIDCEECSARDLNHTRAPFTRDGFLLARSSFVGVKISKKEGLHGQHKDSQVSNAS